MSVRVNLLPEDVQARGRASRVRWIAAAFGLLLVLALGALSFIQRGEIDDARDRLADAEAVNADLQAGIAALQPFSDLDQRATQASELVEEAMADEIALSGILQDLSAVLPSSVELDSVAVSIQPDAAAPQPGGTRLIRGQITASGRTVSIAPGVERLLIDLERVAAFDNVYVTSSSTSTDGITSFSLEIELGPEVLTQRYVLGQGGGES